MELMNRLNKAVWLIVAFGIFSCEEPFNPAGPDTPDDIVIEGYIEAGNAARPTYVLITRAIPFFSELSAEELSDIYVRGADVRVRDQDENITILTELCWQDLDPQIRELVAQQLGIPSGQIAVNLCAYVDVSNSINAMEGGTYELDVMIDGKGLSASTTIPAHVPLDSLWFEVPRGEPVDSLAELWCRIRDPLESENFYRYMTADNSENFRAGFTSVTDDVFFNGQSFNFPLTRAVNGDGEDVDPASFGLFVRGDTARVRWLNIDESHYNFWSTLEAARTRQGPFSSYVRIASNIQGGLGIWGGYSVSEYELVVPPQ